MSNKGAISILVIIIITVFGGAILLSQNQEKILGAVGQSREWVYTRSSGLVRSLTNTQGTLVSNSGSTATTSAVAFEVIGTSLFDAATSTNFAVTGLTSGNCVEAGAGGHLLSASAACGSGSGGGGAWEALASNSLELTPTTTNAGIFVDSASSTIKVLRAPTLNASTTLIDTLTLNNALTVANGGSGAGTFTDHGVLIGSAASAFTALSVGTNGQLLIGSTGADPVFATLTCDSNLTCTTGAGTLEIDVDDSFFLTTGDVVTGSSTITLLTIADAATSTTLVLGVTNHPTINLIDGDLWVVRATTTNLAITGIISCTEALETDGGGNVICGTDATAAGGTDIFQWNTFFKAGLEVRAPTGTAVGLVIGATVTTTAPFAVESGGRASTTELWVTGNATTTGSNNAGEFFVDSASPDAHLYTIEAGNGALDLINDGTVVTQLRSGNDSYINADVHASFGVGLSSPAEVLDVANGIKVTDSSAPNDTLLWLYDSSDDGILDIYQDDSVVIKFHGNAASYINSGSNFGIGLTGPTSTLQIVGTLNVQEAATTSSIVIGTNNHPTINLIDGDLWAVRSTTTNLAISGLGQVPLYANSDGSVISAGTGVSGNCIEWGANNILVDSSASCGGGSGDAFAWTDQGLYVSTSTAVSFESGLMATASSTFTGPDLRVQGNLFASTTLITTLTLTNDLVVAEGGTGVSMLTDGGVLLGSGTAAITALGQATNGQLVIGSTGADPVLGALTCDTNITCTIGAGTLEIDVDDSFLLLAGDTSSGNYDFTGDIVINSASTTITNLVVSGNLFATTSLIDTLTLTNALTVANGGSGATSLTDGGILLGSGTNAITALGVAANGQIPIGDNSTDPVLNEIDGTSLEVEITNGAGTITVGLPNDVTIGGNLIVTTNATTSGYLVLGTTDPLNNMAAGDALFGGNATTTSTSTAQGFKGLNLISCDTINTDAAGHFECGDDATGGGGASAWEATSTAGFLTDTITPTTSAASIVVNGTATTTKLVVTSIALGNEFLQIFQDGTDANIVQNTGDLNLGVANQAIFLESNTFINAPSSTIIRLRVPDGLFATTTLIDNLTVVTTFELPNGTTPVADDPGELAHDTTDNQLILDDFVIAKATTKIWSVTVASTSPAFIGAALLPVPTNLDGYTMTAIRCKVDSGTSKIVAVEDASANSTEDITCATTVTSDDGSITNALVTAAEEMYIDFGATDGSVDYVTISVFGQWTRE